MLPASPHPLEHLVLLGGPAPLSAWLLSSGAARRVSTQPIGAREADAIVILSDAEVSVEEVAACLIPGGSLYWEIERGVRSWRDRSPARIRQRLRRVGLRSGEFYWVHPSFRGPQVYLPLGWGRTLRWYWNNVFVPRGRRERLLARAASVLERLPGCAVTWGIAHFGVTAVAEARPSAAAVVLGGAEFFAELRGRDLRPVLLTAGANELDRVVLAAFEKRGREPVAIFKCARAPERNGNTENEQHALAEVRPMLDERMRGTLPRPLGTFTWGSVTVGVETFLPGRSLSLSRAGWRVSKAAMREDLDLVTSWLAEFHLQTRVVQPVWGPEQERRWLEPALASYEAAFEVSPSELSLFSKVRERSRCLAGSLVPIVWQHNSFGPWNLGRAARGLRVIDWEGAAVGLPLFDLLYFLLQWSVPALRVRNEADRLRAFRELFCGEVTEDPMVWSARRAVNRYLGRLEIDPAFLPVLTVLLWAGHALGRVELVRTEGTGGTSPRTDNAYVRLVETLASSVETLFSEKGPTVSGPFERESAGI